MSERALRQQPAHLLLVLTLQSVARLLRHRKRLALLRAVGGQREDAPHLLASVLAARPEHRLPRLLQRHLRRVQLASFLGACGDQLLHLGRVLLGECLARGLRLGQLLALARALVLDEQHLRGVSGADGDTRRLRSIQILLHSQTRRLVLLELTPCHQMRRLAP
eukprot:4112580-Prymnesium_polylepis.1